MLGIELLFEIRAILIILFAPLGLYYIYGLVNPELSHTRLNKTYRKNKKVFTKKFYKDMRLLLIFDLIIFFIILFPQIWL